MDTSSDRFPAVYLRRAVAASRTGIGYATRELMLVATCSMAVESVARRIAGGALAAICLVLVPSPAGAAHGVPIPVLTTAPEYAKRLLDGGHPIVFVDLRPREDFAHGRLPHALSVPLPELRRRYHEISQTELVILYCDCPPEALAAAFRFVAGEGYQNASVLAEGFRGWVKRGYPVEPR
jgi:rhodanese-related sulfurtransferase